MRCSKNQKLIAIAVAENVHTGLHKISTLSMSDSQVYLYVLQIWLSSTYFCKKQNPRPVDFVKHFSGLCFTFLWDLKNFFFENPIIIIFNVYFILFYLASDRYRLTVLFYSHNSLLVSIFHTQKSNNHTTYLCMSDLYISKNPVVC